MLSLLPRKHRRVVRETWNLIDVKLGAYVRGQLLMVTFVGTVLSTAFALIGLPFWLLLGVFAGIVEIVAGDRPARCRQPRRRRRAHGRLAARRSWPRSRSGGLPAAAGLRWIGPHVFGRAVGLSPLIVLVTVSAVGLLFGGVYVLLWVPLAAVLATLADVLILNRDPAKQEVPRILFPAKDAES